MNMTINDQNTEDASRVLVIGLDGASWDILEPLIQDGKLPTFDRLYQEGSHGILMSTVPPITPPAWTSMVTGMNPGNHGIFDMVSVDKDYNRLLPLSSDVKTKTIWDLVKNCVVIDFPVSYPPKKINGVIISGMFTPDRTKEFTYPDTLKKEILEDFPDYTFDLHWERYEGKKNQLLKNLYRMTDTRVELLYKFLESDWEFMFVVFTGTDRLQHVAWHSPELTAYYQYLDKVLQDILEKIDRTPTILFIVSDHGFGEVKKVVHINTFLVKEGYLHLRLKPQKSLLGRMGVTEESVFRLFNRFVTMDTRLVLKYPQLTRMVRRILPRKCTFDFEHDVDWAKTKAFFTGFGVYINRVSRFSQGIIDNNIVTEIVEKLQDIKDIETGENVLEAIYRKEDIYSGPFLSEAPDIVILPREGYALSEQLGEMTEDAGYLKADHRPEGMYMVWGSGIKTGTRMQAVIHDIAPTVLHILRVPLPPELDGRVLQEVFKEDSGLTREPVIRKIDEKTKIKKGVKRLDSV